jgi:hypothetical protein
MVSCCDAELKLLLPEHRVEINSRKWIESLGDIDGGGDAGGGDGGGDVADVYGDGVRDIRLSKKTASGSGDRCMLLPLNP